MNIVFLSNCYNHHQAAISEKLYQLTDSNYFFIETQEMTEERKRMGWGNDGRPDFVKRSYELCKREFQNIIDYADLIIIGSAPSRLIKKYLVSKRLVFRYSERVLKRGDSWFEVFARKVLYRLRNYGSKNIYLLCASAYAAADYAKLNLYKDKTYKWGYFPEVKKYENIGEVIKAKKKASILWVARLIEWKHPEDSIKVAKRLKQAGYSFELNIIGNGILENDLESMIASEGLENCVHMLGAMSPDQVRTYMEQSEIFLFTSDRNEGWGAVLNESMNSGCAVVASHAIGSVPFLIKDNENGLIYKDGNIDDLYEKVKLLLNDNDYRQSLGTNAYETMTTEWNAETAADRLLRLIKDVQNEGECRAFYEGPCSKAEIVKDDWI